MEQKKYWQSFGEFTNSESFQKKQQDEFQEESMAESLGELANANTPRRDFLKYLGFSTAAAAVAAGCEVPVKKAIPYVNKPQDLIPGVADYYATTFVSGGDAIAVVAKVRDGRPVKIEGNTLSTINNGGTTARAQASVLDLYDTARLRSPLVKGKDGFAAASFENIDKSIADGLAAGKVVLLTATVTSPSTKQIITEFLAKYPGSRHVQYDGVSYSALLEANEASYGKRAIPSYQFDKAKVIVSLGADFLGTWLNSVEYQRGYAAGRKINPSNPEMNKHIQFESMMSMTGANADERFTHKPSEAGAVAVAILNALNGQAVTGVSDKVKKGVEKTVAALNAHKGAALVVSGSNDVNVQLVVNAINEAIGANGTTVNWANPLLIRQGLDSEMATLVADMEAGNVNALLVYDANPVYNYFDSARFVKALAKVATTVNFADRMDETAELCKYIVPTHHYLESWGDAQVKEGYISILQPTINPLFKTRQLQDSLLKWSGSTVSYHDYFKNYWVAKLGGEAAYTKLLMDGVNEPAAASAGAAYNAGRLADATAAIGSAKKGGKYEVVLYQKVGVGEGRQANNPWLLELADPVTKACWDNYAMISPALGKELLGIDITDRQQADTYEVNPEKPQVDLKVGSVTLTLAAMIVPGMPENTIAVAVGFGRSEKVGMAVKNAGQNAYKLAASTNWNITNAEIAKSAADKYPIAQNQTHASYEGRHEVVKEELLAAYKKNPTAILDGREAELKAWGGVKDFEKQGTIYGVYDRPGIKWGMSIDMNSCFGCGACVVACNAENNVAVVGKSEVMRFHDMQWLRIDRYFAGDPNDADSIQTVFMPMLCQHCDNAPCENVCPVAATNHSSEGLNQMTYNRCIGTRYCANNCPYKVRRFNWADYMGADSFKDNQKFGTVGGLDDSVLMMNDELTRMVLNPDVTVRSRGVIEKCSFCVQRLQEGKLKAKKENRTLQDSDVKTACQQACAGDAIVFGNVNNKESEVSKVRTENVNRMFYSLEMLHVLPNVSYLAKVRNSDVLAAGGHEEAHQEEKKEGAKEAAHH